jgi:transposase
VFVDETGATIALTALYARAPRGQRAVGKVPRNYGANTTLMASLSRQGMGEAFILEGAADAIAFELYIEQILAPSLRSGQIVIMDNLSIHQGERVRQAIEAKGCQLLFLPAYSPDLSPIEEAFSKLKAYLRRVGARTHEDLFLRHRAGFAHRHCCRCAWLVYPLWLPDTYSIRAAILLGNGGAYSSMILYTALVVQPVRSGS